MYIISLYYFPNKDHSEGFGLRTFQGHGQASAACCEPGTWNWLVAARASIGLKHSDNHAAEIYG